MQSSEISRALETWYSRPRSEVLWERTGERLQAILDLAFGYHVVQLGPLPGRRLVDGSPINHRILAGPCHDGAAPVDLCCHGDELPLESDSVDMLVAFHALEFDAHPHGCLREMQRVLRSQGHLVIIGFNPRSLMGASMAVQGLRPSGLWHHHRPVSLHRLTDWLRLLDCELASVQHLFPLPPAGESRLRGLAEKVDRWATRHRLPGGSLYIVHAVKQIAGMRRPLPKPATLRALPGLTVAAGSRARNPAGTGGVAGSNVAHLHKPEQ